MTFDVGRWCERHLDSAVEEVRVVSDHLSRVLTVRLSAGREVVVKVRPHSPRLTGCVTVQRALWRAGLPAPEPLVGPVVEAGLAVSAEAYVPGGSMAPETDHVGRSAGLLAGFVALAPPPSMVGPGRSRRGPERSRAHDGVAGRDRGAGLWVYAFDAKKASLDGASWRAPEEAAQRLALAGA